MFGWAENCESRILFIKRRERNRVERCLTPCSGGHMAPIFLNCEIKIKLEIIHQGGVYSMFTIPPTVRGNVTVHYNAESWHTRGKGDATMISSYRTNFRYLELWVSKRRRWRLWWGGWRIFGNGVKGGQIKVQCYYHPLRRGRALCYSKPSNPFNFLERWRESSWGLLRAIYWISFKGFLKFNSEGIGSRYREN